MQDKTIITICIGMTSIVSIVGSYMSYLFIMRPATDGVVFGSVVTAIGAISAGIIGFHFGKDTCTTTTTPEQ
jgi:hypothetical protein